MHPFGHKSNRHQYSQYLIDIFCQKNIWELYAYGHHKHNDYSLKCLEYEETDVFGNVIYGYLLDKYKKIYPI